MGRDPVPAGLTPPGPPGQEGTTGTGWARDTPVDSGLTSESIAISGFSRNKVFGPRSGESGGSRAARGHVTTLASIFGCMSISFFLYRYNSFIPSQNVGEGVSHKSRKRQVAPSGAKWCQVALLGAKWRFSQKGSLRRLEDRDGYNPL